MKKTFWTKTTIVVWLIHLVFLLHFRSSHGRRLYGIRRDHLRPCTIIQTNRNPSHNPCIARCICSRVLTLIWSVWCFTELTEECWDLHMGTLWRAVQCPSMFNLVSPCSLTCILYLERKDPCRMKLTKSRGKPTKTYLLLLNTRNLATIWCTEGGQHIESERT